MASLLSEQWGRQALRDRGIVPMTRLLIVCGGGQPAMGLAGALAERLELGAHRLDIRRVALLDEQGRRARLQDTWHRIAQDRAVYILDGIEALEGAALSLLCRLLETDWASDSVVVGVGYGEVVPALASRFDVRWEPPAGEEGT